MLWIRRILLMGGVLFIALLVVVMVLENRQVTHFELFGLLTPELPVVLYVALVFILGGFIGLLAGSSLLARANIRIKAIEKDLAKARKREIPYLLGFLHRVMGADNGLRRKDS